MTCNKMSYLCSKECLIEFYYYAGKRKRNPVIEDGIPLSINKGKLDKWERNGVCIKNRV